MDQRRVRTSRLPALSRRGKPCLRAEDGRSGFAGGDLFRGGRYVSTGACEVVRDFERKNAPLRSSPLLFKDPISEIAEKF